MPAGEPVKTKGSVALRSLFAGRYTQEELAQKLGVTQQTISNWAKGVRRPPAEKMAEIEDALGIPMRAWTEDPPEPESTEETPPSDSSQPAAE